MTYHRIQFPFYVLLSLTFNDTRQATLCYRKQQNTRNQLLISVLVKSPCNFVKF